jgi:hypothetical protein
MLDEAAEIGDELGSGGSITWIAAGQGADSHCQQKIHHGGTETRRESKDLVITMLGFQFRRFWQFWHFWQFSIRPC